MAHEAISSYSDTAKSIVKGRYRHYKGGLYNVVAVGRNECDLSEVVVYSSADDPLQVWVRPLGDFSGTVEHNGIIVRRFEATE